VFLAARVKMSSPDRFHCLSNVIRGVVPPGTGDKATHPMPGGAMSMNCGTPSSCDRRNQR
jgi:hypothetical protein